MFEPDLSSRRWHTSCLVLALWAFAATAHAGEPIDHLTIVAPAAAGGGWDQTAHVMADVLESAQIVRHVDVVNSPGAGGAIALAEFITRRGDSHSLMLGGLVMLGAIQANGATVSMLQTTPLARLNAEPEVMVVRSDSPVRSLTDVIAAMRSQPALVWTGGSYGGTDHLLLRMVAEAVGVDASNVNYIPHAGGGAGLQALLSGQSSAGVGGYSEFAEGIRSGQLRAVAISSERRLLGVGIPTLKEQGVDVAVMNWRGVFAPPNLASGDQQRLADAINRMVHQPAWERALAERGWTDVYLAGVPYAQFVDAEHRRIEDYFAQASRREHHDSQSLVGVSSVGAGTYARAMALPSGLILALLGGFLWFVYARSAAGARELALQRQLDDARTEVACQRDKARELESGLGEEIERQFEKWGLTAAERQVALLILKGLRHKEIALARHTSEGTVRQQALMVYKKARLDGRTDLAAFFLEDLLPPRITDDQPAHATAVP